MVIKRISPMSCAKVSGLLYAALGLVFGAFFSLIMMSVGSLIPQDESQMAGPIIGMMFGAGAIIFAPLFYGVMGFIMGGLTAVAYNFVAGWTGGLELDVQ